MSAGEFHYYTGLKILVSAVDAAPDSQQFRPWPYLRE